MLTRLLIRQYAIIESLDLDLRPGLTVITGETGAGKSILLGALGLALGRRADGRVLPDGADKCVVEAHFTLPDESLRPLHDAAGVDFEQVMICRREIAAGGRSRSFVNDTPVSLKVMQELTAGCIELHHQHDNLALQSKTYQLDLLDTISGARPARESYADAYKALAHVRQELRSAHDLEAQALRKKDFLRFQLDELNNARLADGEMAKLEDQQRALEHAEAISGVIGQLEQTLQHGPHALLNQLSQAIKQVEGIKPYYPAIGDIGARLEALRIEVQDLGMETSRLDVPGEADPNQLQRVQQRLSHLYGLLKKYQCADESQLLALQRQLQDEFARIESIADTIRTLEADAERLALAVLTAGKSLTDARRAGGSALTPQIMHLLRELGMPNAQFDVSLEPLGEPGPAGLDDVQFVFSANRGMALQPIQQVASGGELSRLSLALKSIYAGQAGVGTIVFDEIDTGISGEVAWRMGQLILSLAAGHQVLMVTHSPQIAAHAMIHYHVSKQASGDRDVSSITLLDKPGRIVEIAKMLSGDPPSAKARANAEELITSVGKR